MAKETWGELYRKYGITDKSNHKNLLVVALIIAAVMVAISLILMNYYNILPIYSSNDTSAPQESARQPNNTTPITPIVPAQAVFSISYNYTDAKFIFSVRNEKKESIETLKISIDGVQTEYSVSSGNMPLKNNETLHFSVSKQLCDKEHTISISDGMTEQKIITYPLVCSSMPLK